MKWPFDMIPLGLIGAIAVILAIVIAGSAVYTIWLIAGVFAEGSTRLVAMVGLWAIIAAVVLT